MSASPWLEPATVAAIGSSGRKILVIAGFATEVVTLHAALGAVAAGYRVLVPVDANGGMSSATEAAAIRQIERAGGGHLRRLARHDAGSGLLDLTGCRNLRCLAEAQARLSFPDNLLRTTGHGMSQLFSLATLAIGGVAQAAIKVDDRYHLLTGLSTTRGRNVPVAIAVCFGVEKGPRLRGDRRPKGTPSFDGFDGGLSISGGLRSGCWLWRQWFEVRREYFVRRKPIKAIAVS